MPSSAAIPVESLLKLTLDKGGAQQIQDFLDKQEGSFSRIEGYAGKISDHFDGLAKGVLGLAGIAGIGAVINQYIQTSQQGGLVGLAAGQVTGGMGVGHSYGQALLGAQAKTGVSSSQIAEGLVQAVQAVGGTPTPNQAAMIGGLLAGYGNTVGMSPAQVASVVAPLLQASNKPLTPGNFLSTAATLSQGLSAFPGSQAAPVLALLSQLGLGQALGVGPTGAFTPDMHSLTAAVNAAAQTNSIFRSPQVAGAAITGISGGLQNAYGSPAMEAFLQMAGVGYYDQRKGFTPKNAEAIISEATRLYGTGITRDLALRSMFGLTSADLLEQLAPGSRGAALLKRDLQLGVHPDQQQLLHQIHNAQLSHTPQADINKFSAEALKWLFSSPLHAALGAVGLLGGTKLAGSALKYGLRGVGRGGGALLKSLRGDAGDLAPSIEGDVLGPFDTVGGAGAVDAGASSLLGSLRGVGLGIGGGVAGAGLGALLFPDGTTEPGFGLSVGGVERHAVAAVLQMAAKRFGAGNIRSAAAQNYMRQLLLTGGGPGTLFFGAQEKQVWGQVPYLFSGGVPPGLESGAMGMLNRTVNGKDPIDAFSQGANDLEKAAAALLNWMQACKGGFTSYNPGSMMGTPAIQALGAGAPGVEYASLMGAGPGGSALAAFTGAPGGTFVSTTPAGRTGPAAGGQPCTLTWYDPALGGINGGGQMANGQPYSTTAFTCAAPPNYAFGTVIEFSYGGKSVKCTVTDRGGAITGSHFDLARAPATALGIIGPGVVQGTFRVVSTGSSSSASNSGGGGGFTGPPAPGGGGGGTWDTTRQPAASVASAGAGGMAGSDPFAAARHAHHAHLQATRPEHHHHQVKVYVDGREQRVHRLLTGHYHD